MTLMLLGKEVIAKFVNPDDADIAAMALWRPDFPVEVRPALTSAEYCKMRKDEARRHGICIQCLFDQAETGKSKCVGCREANKAKRHVKH